ncbi:MAG: hypothetical protein U0905_19645 [Pirellulales bacterium]
MKRFAFFITVAIGPAECGRTSQVRGPLVDPKDATEANAIVGVYSLVQESGEHRHLHVGKAGKGYPANFLSLLWVSYTRQGELGAIGWTVFACEIHQKYIQHIPVPKNLKL